MRHLRRIHIDDIDRDEMLARASNPLETLYYRHQGRIALKWHHYLELYDRHLGRFRGLPVRVLELGILSGGSLQIWKSYFGERGVIHGVDIDPGCAQYAEERVIPHIGSQVDADFLRRVVEQMGGVDIIIDDASHRSSDQITSFEVLYPLLDANGVYICEDTRTSYWNRYGGGYRKPSTFIEYAKRHVDQMHAWYIEDETAARDETFARMTLGISFYDSMVVFEKRAKDVPFQCSVGRKGAHSKATNSGVTVSLPLSPTSLAGRPAELSADAVPEDSIIDRFDSIARRFASRLAIQDATASLTYAELAALVDRIAEATIAATKGRDGPVAILLRNEARYPAALLGVLAAGRAFIPLESNNPIEHNRAIIAHAKAVALISAGDLAVNADAFPKTLTTIDIDHLVANSPSPRPHRPTANDIAYIIYTSGSTGAPKGVYQNHRGILHEVLQFTEMLDLDFDDRLVLFNAPSVKRSVKLSLAGLLIGASLHCLAPVGLTPAALAAKVRALGITVLWLVPPLLRHIVEGLGLSEKLDAVRFINIGGDRVTWHEFDLFQRACSPQARLCINLGSTECGTCAQWFVDERLRGSSQRLPVGRALPHLTMTIVDDEGRPVADGEVGEINVTGRYIALGYWQDPKLTARAFATDPADPRLRTYKTGDLALRRPDGLIEFVGRKDQRIKLRGRWIEIAEVELALRQCAGVKDAAIVVRRNESGAARSLAAYVEVRPGAPNLTSGDLISTLAQQLPRHMVPSTIGLVDELPRLPGLKIDRMRLEQMDTSRMAKTLDPIRDPLIHEVVEIFKSVLGTRSATPDDNIASLGGDSLQSVNVALALEERFHIEIPDSLFESTNTIRELAHWIAAQKQDHEPADPAMLAAELEASFSERRAPRFDQGTASNWIELIHDFIYFRRFEVGEHAVRHFHAKFPNNSYGRYLNSVFDSLPQAGSQLPFEDDFCKDIQIVERQGAETVILLFCGAANVLNFPIPIEHRWHGRLNASLIYLRDFQNVRYLRGLLSHGASRDATLAELRRIIAWLGARRIVCYGTSGGVFGALRYALDLEADAVLCMAGPTNFSPEFNRDTPLEAKAIALQDEMPDVTLDLRRVYERAARPPRVRIFYSRNHREDRRHAEHMGALSCVALQPVEDFDEHNVALGLIQRGQFEKALQWLVPPAATASPRWLTLVRHQIASRIRSIRGNYGLFGKPSDLYDTRTVRTNWSVSASAITEPQYGPEFLLGPKTVIWHAPWEGRPQWVRFEADHPVQISEIKIVAQDGHPDRAPRTFRFQVSDDGEAWSNLLAVDDARFAQQIMSCPLAMTRAYRHFRIEILANNGAPKFLTIQRVVLSVLK